jgi:aminoglycoside phosphotransferase (APT) family kinase protein
VNSTENPETQIRAGLERLAPRFRQDAAGLTRLERLSGGATQEIWRFDLDTPAGTARYILRRAPGGTRITEGVGLEVEAELMAAAARQNVPVAAVAHVLRPEDGLGRGFVMAFVEGETLGGRIVKADGLTAARQTLAAECGAILGRIHAIPTSGFPSLEREAPSDMVERWRVAYRATPVRRPVFDLAFRWLADHAPSPVASPKLVHGDFRNGNLMVGSDGIRAVLDWELAHIGDPMEDLAWICVNSWRFGRMDKPVGGFGTYADLFEAYEMVTAMPVDPQAVRWWEAYGTIRWGTICAASITAYRGDDRTLERAMIARRTSETEIDLLRLIAS